MERRKTVQTQSYGLAALLRYDIFRRAVISMPRTLGCEPTPARASGCEPLSTTPGYPSDRASAAVPSYPSGRASAASVRAAPPAAPGHPPGRASAAAVQTNARAGAAGGAAGVKSSDRSGAAPGTPFRMTVHNPDTFPGLADSGRAGWEWYPVKMVRWRAACAA